MDTRRQRYEEQLSRLKTNTTEKVDVILELGWTASDIPYSVSMTEKGLKLAKKLKYKKGVARAYANLGLINGVQSNADLAMSYTEKALKISQELNDKSGIGSCLMIKGIASMNLGDYDKGFGHLQDALKLLKQTDNNEMTGWTIFSIGNLHFDLNDKKKALKYYKEAERVFSQTDLETGKARCLSGIGSVYQHQGDYEKALKFHMRSLEMHRKTDNPIGQSRSLNDIGQIYRLQGHFKQALKYHEESLVMREKMNYRQGIMTTLQDLGLLYHEQKQFKKARVYYEKALLMAQETRAKAKLSRTMSLLTEHYKAVKNYKKALEYHEEFLKLEKELYNEDIETQLTNLKSSYEADKSKQEAEIYRLKNVELKEKNKKLKEVINELKAAQARIIQAEKMGSLGKLAAGIAHEINNPIGVINSSSDVSSRSLKRISQSLEKIKTLEDLTQSKEFNKSLNLIDINLNTTAIASDRIGSIVKSLRNFSGLDESDYQLADLHEGIESTLTLLTSEMIKGVVVSKEYGDIPKILCYPTELNQVFMNIIVNSLEAMDKKGTLYIKTDSDKENVYVTITDTGKGIPKDKLKMIFDPIFSKKDSRIALGIGLYTSHSIILKHNGIMNIQSEVGKGTTCTITLPIVN